MSRILIIDDEPSVRTMLRRVLQQAGHIVLEASNGREAWLCGVGTGRMFRRRVDVPST